MKQIRFIPSGCQFWYKNIISASGDSFAYCSTMAIYFYNLKDFQVDKIISCHDTIITSISWSPQNPYRLACTCLDGILYIWDIEKEIPEIKLSLNGLLPLQCEFNYSENELLAILVDNGDIKIYDPILNKLEKFNNFEGAKLIKWNPSAVEKLAIGCDDGRLIIHTFQRNKTIKLVFKQKIGIDAIEWDPNSHNYLLVSWKDGSLSLIDSDDEKEMQVFDKQGTGITCIVWIKTIPGGFITCNDKLSMVRVWNVSNKTPLSTIRIGTSSIMNIISLNNASYGKEGLLCTFRDGSVGLFNFVKKKIEFLSQPNHSETIFETQFKPNDKDILATASFDGSIKIWNIKSMQCISNLSKNPLQYGNNISNGIKSALSLKNQAIYCLSWHPNGENKLISGNASGEIMLWDINKSKLLTELQIGSNNGPIYKIEWNFLHPIYIASGSSENFAYVYSIDDSNKLNIYRRLKHPGMVFGISWNPINKNILATACQDGIMRLFDIQMDQLLKTFQGHTAKIFNIVWNSINPNLIASGSDDKTIRIWDLQTGNSFILQGHTNHVRGLVWNTELPWLLLSGSWDATIRIWDIRERKCLHIATDHHSDVYSISTHQDRPFMYVSCSRDTSLRIWTLERLITPLILRLLITNDWNNMLGYNKNLNQFKLYGNKGTSLANEAKDLIKMPVEYYHKIMDFFYYHEYQNELWDIIKALLLSKNEDINNKVITLKNLPIAYLAKAKELESSNQIMFLYDPLNKKVDRLNEAANLYLTLGEFENYCEILIKLNKWERALAFAPAVSYDYWQNLAKRYAEYLKTEESNEADEGFIMAGQFDDAIKFYMGRGDYEDAKLICHLKSTGRFDSLIKNERYKLNNNDDPTPKALNVKANNQSDYILREIIENLAENYLRNGQPLLAAASHLAINDPEGAILKLLRANELLYAYTLTKLFNTNHDSLVISALSKTIERLNDIPLGQAMLKQTKNDYLLAIFLANNNNIQGFYKASYNSLYNEYGLFTCDKNESEGEKHLAKGNISFAIYHFLLCKNLEKACSISLHFAKDCFYKKEYEKIGQLIEVFDVLSNFSIASLGNKAKLEIIALSTYFGLKKAIWKGYYPVVMILYKTLKRLLKSNKDIEFPLSVNVVKLEVYSYLSYLKPEEIYQKLGTLVKMPINESKKVYALNLMKNLTENVIKDSKIKQFQREMNRNRVYITGNNLPTRNKNPEFHLRSYLTKTPIKGEGYRLDDNQSLVSLEEAIMLYNSNRYSVIGSGNLINPF